MKGWEGEKKSAIRICIDIYNDKAKSGNKWNVPVGLFVGKTVKFGKMPVNIKAGLEYSVVSEDAFGKRAVFRFQITPVIQSLITEPIFGK